jgi:hypothetical protein
MVFPYSVKRSSLIASRKLENGVSSFSSDPKIGIAEVCGGFGKGLDSAIEDSSFKGSSFFVSTGLSARIWSKIYLALTDVICQKDPPEAMLRNLEYFLVRPT